MVDSRERSQKIRTAPEAGLLSRPPFTASQAPRVDSGRPLIPRALDAPQPSPSAPDSHSRHVPSGRPCSLTVRPVVDKRPFTNPLGLLPSSAVPLSCLLLSKSSLLRSHGSCAALLSVPPCTLLACALVSFCRVDDPLHCWGLPCPSSRRSHGRFGQRGPPPGGGVDGDGCHVGRDDEHHVGLEAG